MKKFDKFYFESFEFDKNKLKAKFNYSFDKEEFFTEIINFNDLNFSVRKNLDLEVINNLLFHIHIVLGISYYKLYPTKELVVESGFLDDYQIKFWKIFYINWLWEFLYTNKISPTNLFNFINNSEKKHIKKDFEIGNKFLVPIWWWKDSIVSIELLKKSWFDIDLYTFWPKDNILYSNTQEISWNNRLFIKRKISNLKGFIEKGYYNWHVPITWIIAFISEFVCYLYNYKYIVLSNEKSASQGNIIWEWIEINHQYSKSLEFEKDFASYVSKYISSDIKYFSLLRWIYEFKIAQLFSKYCFQYFEKFASCNNNFKIFNKIVNNSLWCNNCPKCAFVFLILSNFLSLEELKNIFWENLFEINELEDTFRELIWLSKYKPFECVWTYEESFLSIYNAIKKYNNKNYIIINKLKKEVLEESNKIDIKKLEDKLLKIYDEDIIPATIKNKLQF